MAPDDHKQSGNSSCGSGSSRSSKKLKQKKVPQRGLGVAQLEKIRLEEQQKKDLPVQQSVLQNSNPILVPNFRQNPPPPPPQIESNAVFETNPGSGFLNQNPRTVSLGQAGSARKLWNGVQILEGESYNFDQSGGSYVFRPNTPNPNAIYEAIPPILNGIPAKELFHPQNSSSIGPAKELFHHQNSSSMVRVSSGNSSSSVITHNQMEPPSNQSFLSKIGASSRWPEEDKLIGIKRPYPFPLDNPRKFVPLHVQYPAARQVEPPKPLLREAPAISSVNPELKKERVLEKNADLDGDFLTLALPKQELPRPNQELSGPGLNLLGNADEPSFYSFLPSSNASNGQATSSVASSSGDVAENLDLNLKL